MMMRPLGGRSCDLLSSRSVPLSTLSRCHLHGRRVSNDRRRCSGQPFRYQPGELLTHTFHHYLIWSAADWNQRLRAERRQQFVTLSHPASAIDVQADTGLCRWAASETFLIQTWIIIDVKMQVMLTGWIHKPKQLCAVWNVMSFTHPHLSPTV